MDSNGFRETQLASFFVGQRICFEGYYGSIRYIGPISLNTSGVELGLSDNAKFTNENPAHDIWIGVEWDLKIRGKHDGSVNGVNYFSCRISGSGSFLNISSIPMNALAKPCSFVEALREKYCANAEDLEKEAQDKLFLVNSVSKQIKKVELIGIQKTCSVQNQLDKCTQASLNSCFIANIDMNLRNVCSNLTELELCENLLYSWEQVFSIGIQLPKLQTLNLSQNRFLPLKQNMVNRMEQSTFDQLKVLVLNRCLISWEEVLLLEPHLPVLEELYLCRNRIDSFGNVGPHKGFHNLKVLDFEGNEFSTWKEIENLAFLPRLERLILNENHIENISSPLLGTISSLPESDTTQEHSIEDNRELAFAHLKSLSLSDNKINSWTSINHLNLFPQLDMLRFLNNPLTKDLSQTASRYLIIARIEKLKILQGSSISKKERIDAEKFYVKRCFTEEEESGIKRNTAEFQLIHPRFQQLAMIHGFTGLEKEKISQTLADEMIALKLVSSDKTISKSLPSSLSVANLKILCQRLFAIDPQQMEIFYKEEMSSPHYELLDDNSRDLSYFGVHKNGILLVQRKLDN